MIGSTNKIPTVRGLSTLVRPRFGPGMLLQHDDLDLLTDYTRELNRLMFRSLFGCGVICGLEVTHDERCGRDTLTVDAGVGLVCSGDPVYVPRPQPIVIDEECAGLTDTELWVVLCGTAKACSPRPSMCASDDDEMGSTATRERDGFEIRVVADRPKCACWCDPPKTKGGGSSAGSSSGGTADGPATTPTKDGAPKESCACVNPDDPCYVDHYQGVCGCTCDGGDGCCDCIVLARLSRARVEDDWTIDHRVRRFIRPVLMRDPAPIRDKARQERAEAGGATTTGGTKTPVTKKKKSPPPQG